MNLAVKIGALAVLLVGLVAFSDAGTIMVGENENFLKTDGNGNLGINGNYTGSNVFIPAYITHHTNVTMPVTSAGQWENISFVDEPEDIMNNIGHSNTTFTINDAGFYYIDYTMEFIDSTANPAGHIATRVLNNNSEIRGSLIEVDLSKQNAHKIASDSFIALLSAGALLQFQFAGDDTTISLSPSSTYGVYPDSAVVNVRRID